MIVWLNLMRFLVALSMCQNVISNGDNISHSRTLRQLVTKYDEPHYMYGVAKSIVQKDNRKPSFEDCNNYKPSVKEEQPKNTFVFKVIAIDPDKADEITYSLVTGGQERSKFGINKNTGEIFTDHVFDRDEPIREISVYLTVRATDNGRPTLDDVCTFKVTIEDINDNPPVFDKSKYDESMSIDTAVGNQVVRVSASDFDDGENNKIEYELLPENDSEYFHIDKSNGIIYLNRSIDRKAGKVYKINVRAFNTIDSTSDAQIEINIRVVESDKKPPYFINAFNSTISLPENFSNFAYEIAKFEALSNIPDKPEIVFELWQGRTEQTNSKKTFLLNQTMNTATIKLGQSLDYERITNYILTLVVRNDYDLAAEHTININIEDVNDNIPYFTEVKTGTISENEPIGTHVMQVRAFDDDGTSANNIVSFVLKSNEDLFEIDSETGNITALESFDRETTDSFTIQVEARDNSPSSLHNTRDPNRIVQYFKIGIADKNDHPPRFTSNEYFAAPVPETRDTNHIVIEVVANDKDTASQITYSIEEGDINNQFAIEPLTGKITIKKKLDFETIQKYTLVIKAFDGSYDDTAIVNIPIANENDNPPMFERNYTTTIQEETIPDGCILIIKAYDPDIQDRTDPQNIQYSIVDKDQQHLLKIDDDGCLKLLAPLDRDLPNGHKNWQVLVKAIDENGRGLDRITDVTVTLTDINDNAPYLTTKMPVVYYENQEVNRRKLITELESEDNDEENNGPPFRYRLDDSASEDIQNKFEIEDNRLYARDSFDREKQKEYFVPILISDHGDPEQSAVSTLYLIIGDINDNAMEMGSSEIFVYNYKGQAPDTNIGRIYVDDPDDWDLPDKYFAWRDSSGHENFLLDNDMGMITMRKGTGAGEYNLDFTVTEESLLIPRHSVDAHVRVIVKEIPEIAVDNSGSIRFFNVSAEQFIEVPRNAPAGTLSMKDRMHKMLAAKLNASLENVDVFTVLNYNTSTLDVRFSAHGSPYYAPERLNNLVIENQEDLQDELKIQIFMINIDECLIERSKCNSSSCITVLQKSEVPILVYTNTTSFVGVNAYTQAECICEEERQMTICLNGGTMKDHETCDCPEGSDGPQCELTNIGFNGDGYALYKPISACENTKITLALQPRLPDGLIMYMGPIKYNPLLPVSDFLSLELIEGYLVLIVDYGTGTRRIKYGAHKMTDNKIHTVDIILQKRSIEMIVDNCKLSSCTNFTDPEGLNEFLNVNAPLQLGGTTANLEDLAKHFSWSDVPQSYGYSGCIKNLTVNGFLYNTGVPSVHKNSDLGCQGAVAMAVSFGIDKNFLIAIIVCFAVLLILLLAVVVQKRQQNGWHEKDMDDIRETIINYEDEGGGERDTDYDLSVLRSPPIYEDKPYKDVLRMNEPNDVPDIAGFLVDKKDTCDKDTGAHPIDDVRHYAYEGDGNSTGSLSSLASCTDDGDLNFDYLSDFGPRFRKLADMYGEEPSDIDSIVEDDQGWRI